MNADQNLATDGHGFSQIQTSREAEQDAQEFPEAFGEF